MKATQEQVNNTLKFIKCKYPSSNNNGLSSYISASADTPLYYLNSPDFLDQVNRSLVWIERAKSFGVRKTIAPRGSSYAIKHEIEKHPVSFGYVCNMAAITAFILSGLKISSEGNPRTNLSIKALKGMKVNECF